MVLAEVINSPAPPPSGPHSNACRYPRSRSPALSFSLYIYIYICVCVCVCVCIYIYIYVSIYMCTHTCIYPHTPLGNSDDPFPRRNNTVKTRASLLHTPAWTPSECKRLLHGHHAHNKQRLPKTLL